MSVCGNFPSKLFRFFDKIEYAESFLAGHIRCLRNHHYQAIECKNRRDQNEGSGFYLKEGLVTSVLVSPNLEEVAECRKETGNVKHHVSFGNAVFLLCTSGPDADLAALRAKFGKYVVEINEPEKLAHDIDSELKKLGQRFLIDGQNVSYTRGGVFPSDSNETLLTDLAYKQKDPRFSDEQEFRFCLIGMDPKRHLTHRCDLDMITLKLSPDPEYLKII
jgi:hypothetical protein